MESAQIQIPSIVLNEDQLTKLNRNVDEEERKALGRKMREACESYGCFFIDCGMISEEEQQRFISTSDEFFSLSDDVKKRYGRKPNIWHGGYIGINPYSRQESFGIYGLTDDEVRSFADHMWPSQGNPSFCEVIQSMKMKLVDVLLSVMRLTFEDLGISADYYDKQAENITSFIRGLKYKRLPKKEKNNNNNDDDDNNTEKKPIEGLMPHVDHSILSILYDNGIQGLEVLSDDGVWFPVSIPKGSLLVLVGDAFEVCSNGKFRAVKHRVTMPEGDKEKYTCALFVLPKDGVTMEVPPEMVSEGDSPVFRSFVFSDFLAKHILDPNVEAIKVFAGVNVVV